MLRKSLSALGVTLALVGSPARAQQTETIEPPSKRQMTFRLVSDNSELPEAQQKRWVAASGSIFPETAGAFEWFLKGNDIAGLTIYFDSPGGSIVGGMRLGDALRKAGARVSIGRTVALGPKPASATRHQLLPTRGICYSSCAYAFLGGQTRLIPQGAGYGVHMFWPGDQMEGLLSRSYGYADIERAQRISANLAAYIQRVGGDLRLLQLAAATPPKGSMRRLSPREILALRIGTLELGRPVVGDPGHWGVALEQKRARLVTGGEWKTPQGLDLSYAFEAACDATPRFHAVRFEMAPKEQLQIDKPLALRRILLASGKEDAVLAQSGKDPLAAPARFPRRMSTRPGEWIGAAGDIPADLLDGAGSRNGTPIALRIEDGDAPTLELPLPHGNLGQVYKDFSAACARIARGENAIP